MDTKLGPETEDILQAAHDWLLVLEDPQATEVDRARFRQWLAADPRHADVYDRAVTFRAAFARLSRDDFDDYIHHPSPRERLAALLDDVSSLFDSLKVRVALGGALAAAAVVALIASL